MVLKADQMRVKALLTETITLLCKNGLNYQSEFAIEALIGITLDQDDVFLVSIKETIRTDLGLDKDLDSPDDRREFRIEATRSSHQDMKDGLDSAPDLSIMVQLDKSDDGQLVTTPNGSSAPVPQKLFRSVHSENTSVDMGDTQTSYSSDSAPSSLTFGMREFDTGSSTTGGGDTLHRERSVDRSDHVRQPPLKKSRTVDESGDRSVKEEESDEDVVVIKEEAGLDTLSCQMESYNRTSMLDTSGSLASSGAATMSHDTISSVASAAAANILPHTLTLSTSTPVFPGCSSWDQLPSISAHSLPQTTASPSATMSGTPSQQSQQMSQNLLSNIKAMDWKTPMNMMIPLEGLPSSNEGSVKRHRIALCIQDKLKIIERLEEGASHGKVAKEYGIGRSTVADIKKKKDRVRLFVSTLDTRTALKRKNLRGAKDVAHEAAVYQWYAGEIVKGNYVTGPALAEKAKFIYWQMHHDEPDFNPDAFRATNGWLACFKERHGINFASKQIKNTD